MGNHNFFTRHPKYLLGNMRGAGFFGNLALERGPNGRYRSLVGNVLWETTISLPTLPSKFLWIKMRGADLFLALERP